MNETPRRKPGRPSLVEGQPSDIVSVRIQSQLHDQACRIAIRRGESVAETVRRALERLVRDETGGRMSL